MSENDGALSLTQVALSGRKELTEVEPWWVAGLGFRSAGGTSFAGEEIAAIQGIDAPTVELDMIWLVDRFDFMQVEYFRYKAPETRPKPPGWTAASVGYNVVGVHVSDFDATLERLAAMGTEPIGEIVGPQGDRRACVADPDDVLVEILERDIEVPGQDQPLRPEIGACLRFVRASVQDLDAALRFFGDAIGLTVSEVVLHGPEHEALWGLEGQEAEVAVLEAGNTFVELVSYPASIATERPDGYRISDEGILNIAFGSTVAPPVRQGLRRVADAGYSVHADMRVDPSLEVNYVTDDQGFNVEMMAMGREMLADFGFVPKPDA